MVKNSDYLYLNKDTHCQPLKIRQGAGLAKILNNYIVSKLQSSMFHELFIPKFRVV